MKASGEQVDDRVVEVRWDAGWRMMRFRDDKPEGNYRSIVDKIVQSITDGIEQDEVRSVRHHHLRVSPSLTPYTHSW